MPPAQIYVIRHAEKPPDKPPPPAKPPEGVDLDGTQDKHSLIVLGWQRAGALVNFFATPQTGIVRPTYVYAEAPPGGDTATGRPLQTITPLAEKLSVTPNINFELGSEQTKLVPDVLQRDGQVVLIAWEHDHIPLIANAILGNTTTAPQRWPGNRFDVVWTFTPTAGGGWEFGQIAELLLAGDLASVIPTDT